MVNAHRESIHNDLKGEYDLVVSIEGSIMIDPKAVSFSIDVGILIEWSVQHDETNS